MVEVFVPVCTPMRLARMPEPWDHPDRIFELKYDGFRSLAYVGQGRTRFVSRKGIEYRRYGELGRRISSALFGREAVLDGEIVCLDGSGVPQFYDLLYNRCAPCFAAFDLLSLDAEDLRQLPVTQRKRKLRELIPAEGGDLLYVQHFDGRGVALFKEVCRRDLEGVVAKYNRAPYGLENSWVKIKNPTYSQAIGQDELFQRRTAYATARTTGL
jgi:bifunctional non-homologous end joining protein LigD